MDSRNSMSVYTDLYELLYLDLAESHGLEHALVVRDCEEIRSRALTEGIGFLTKTLPLYGKRLDSALSGTVKFDITGLTTRSDGYPNLFGCLTELVFEVRPIIGEAKELWVKPDTDVTAIRHLRQLYYYMYKLELDYDKETEQSVFDAFIQTDRELPSLGTLSSVGQKILRTASILTCSVFGAFDHTRITPRHGPGSVATGESLEGKLSFSRLYRGLDVEYPFTGYFMSGLNHVVDEPGYIDALIEEPVALAKVVLVPKDSRGPRLISMEPLELQWIQQGLMREIVPLLETHPKTRGHVNFRDQTINRCLALESSATQEWATLDMKEASDRVGLELVKSLFQLCPCLAGILACRSDGTVLPNGTKVMFNKFAPMGSALCFPVEAFVFYALSVSVLINVLGYSPKRARRAVYVYGDDIIVRSEAVSAVLLHLPEFGLLFNDRKCCVAGFFRESCGCDAYKGVDITPLRLRKTLISHRRNSKSGAFYLCAVTIASTVAHSNAMHERGCYRVAEYLRRWVEAVIGPLPLATSADSLAGVLAFVRPEVANREHNRQFRRRMSVEHTYQLRSWRVSVAINTTPTDSWRSVLSWFTNTGSETPTDTYADPSRLKLKKGWTNYL